MCSWDARLQKHKHSNELSYEKKKMNFDGASARSSVKLVAMPLYVAEQDTTYTAMDFNLSLPNYKQTDRVLLQRCVMSLRLQYKFTSSPLLFTLEVRDIRTDTVLGSSPYGQEDFSTDWNTLSEDFMLDEFDSRYIKIYLLMSQDVTQSFVVRKRSFVSINSI